METKSECQASLGFTLGKLNNVRGEWQDYLQRCPQISCIPLAPTENKVSTVRPVTHTGYFQTYPCFPRKDASFKEMKHFGQSQCQEVAALTLVL